VYSAEYVIEEIKELVSNGTKIVRFEDDTLVTNIDRLKKIKELVITNGLNKQIQFSCWARANEVTAEATECLQAMNVSLVWMGLESGCQRTLDYLKGNVTVEQNLRAVTLLKDAGIQINGFFVIGSPHETEEELMQTYKFIKDSRLDFATVNILTPMPGTACWDYWTEKNPLVNGQDWSRLFPRSADNSSNIILSEELSHEDLRRIYKKFLKLSQRKNRIAHLKKLRPSELPRIVSELVLELQLRYKRLLRGRFANIKKQ
jgi:anaerobic magnesium-protoporphyrin IX monomethyl ester cyclase